MPFIAALLLFVTASMPCIKPLTPRIHAWHQFSNGMHRGGGLGWFIGFFPQTLFPNLPLLKVMVLDGKTDIANQLAWRICRIFPADLWPAIAKHMAHEAEPRYREWIAQAPPMENCKD